MTYSFQIISPQALYYNSATDTFDLIANYDPNVHNLVVTVTDDDATMDSSGDGNQTAVITDMSGNVVASGIIAVPMYAAINVSADGNTNTGYVDRIEVDNVRYGYSTSETLTPGSSYPFMGASSYDDPHSYYENNSVAQGQPSAPCFVSGTMLLTRDGIMPVDWITVGHDLWTQDNGWQAVRWRGRYPCSDRPGFPRPIRIGPGALGPASPAGSLRVSPQHRIQLSGPVIAQLFGVQEVFVAAKFLLGWPGVSEDGMHRDEAYHHLLLDRHEVLSGDGVGLESLYLGAQMELRETAPPPRLARALAAGHRQTARLCLTAREVKALPRGGFACTLTPPPQSPEIHAEGPLIGTG
ncbi:Hint domain-containing protein [Gymnodinialimonas ulvae]|uniref:Hint domain-containing protein n=1 Tax=Gymnodinialimonas ulvae TaxID=3126504 RepID=UPI003096E92E